MRRSLRRGSGRVSSTWHRQSVRLSAAAVALALGMVLAATARGEPEAKTALVRATGALSLANSRDGFAILSAGGLAPGRSAAGTVTVQNSGDAPGDVLLSTSALSEIAGPRGGALSARLAVVIEDITRADAPATVRAGGLVLSTPVSLGTLRPQEARTYRFTASLPDGGVPAGADSGDNRYQGASVSVRYDWTLAAAAAPPAPPPHPDPPPPSAPPPVPPVPDLAAPTAPVRPPQPLEITLAPARRQRVRGDTVVSASAKCSERCRLTTKAKVRGAGARRLKLRGRTLSLPSEAARVVSFTGSQTALVAIRRALARRRAVSVDITVTATGASGTAASARATVALRP
jgi:hypothetical protein